MRKLTDHIVSGDQAVQLQINVMDEPGRGGACHRYSVLATTAPEHVPLGYDMETNADGTATYEACFVGFQNGPIREFGVNGITQEALLAIVVDRLRCFQAGEFSCRENAIALTHIEEALMWLQRRTVARIKRGVEGTNEK